MEAKKNRPINTTITRDTSLFSEGTENIYETVAVLSKRSNQIASDMKRELHKKIEEFSSSIDTMDEIYENREQIEVVRHYEQMPKPTLMATQEYLNGDIYFRNPAKEDKNMQRLEAMENEAIAEGAVAEKK
ncbi:MAG: DNA-directed RNA polymerase subunit omega [Bacteroidales bacterium]|nr:DNA-directed RNA polymerase subunit omega [Bacteroidales bacterium]